jgi:hypothetical protein
MSRFLTLCVNYKNDAETAEFARTVRGLPGYSGHVVVVSNSEVEDGGQLSGLSDAESILLAVPERNLGYFGGAAWGLDLYLKDNPLPEWIIVSNTDLSFPDREFFRKLEELYGSDPPAIVAPDIVLQPRGNLPSSNDHQNPHLAVRPSPARMQILRSVARFYVVYVAYEFASSLRYRIRNAWMKVLDRRSAFTDAVPIYAPFGAFIIFHRGYFDAGGSLRYPSFLFGEEIYVAETARSFGLRVMYEPRLRVAHHEHGAVGKIASRRIARCVSQSYDYLVRAYF